MDGTEHHMEAEALERYAMGTLPEQQADELGEHLLVCADCQDRLAETDAYLQAMRTAAPKMRGTAAAGFGVWSRLWSAVALPPPLWAATAIVLVAVGLELRRPAPGGAQPPVPVQLEASRASLNAHAAAGRLLVLSIGLEELPPHPAYRLEAVDARGNRLWEVTAAPKEGKLSHAPAAALAAGAYFVRLYTPDRELLREFALIVE